jgi:hypothetical protein
VIVKKIGINKTTKITRRLSKFMLPRIQPAARTSSNDCMSLQTERTASTAIASFPIPSEALHFCHKCIAVNNGLYSFVIRLAIKIGENLQGS